MADNEGGGGSGWLGFLAGIIVVEIAAVVFVSFKHTLGWDGLLKGQPLNRFIIDLADKIA